MRYLILSLLIITAAPIAIFFWLKTNVVAVPDQNSEKIWLQPLPNPPNIIKAIYATEWSVSNSKKIDALIELIEKTELNALVFDIKDYSGYLVYDPQLPETIKSGAATNRIANLNELVEKLHNKNIYLIGRLTVFQDPVLTAARPDLAVKDKNGAVWKDHKGLSWLDPSSREVWDYHIAIAKDLIKRGFDEINFDYVRFPSDGDNVNDLIYPFWNKFTSSKNQPLTKREIIKSFFAYLRSALSNAKISVDVFGQTTINRDDMEIGQIIEDAYKYFDYVSPMVYPSHFINGFMGFANPADYPYEVVKLSMTEAEKRLKNLRELQKIASTTVTNSKLRPWLQVFDLGAVYTPAKVYQQIQAVQELITATPDSFNGYFLWSPSNIYPSNVNY